MDGFREQKTKLAKLCSEVSFMVGESVPNESEPVVFSRCAGTVNNTTFSPKKQSACFAKETIVYSGGKWVIQAIFTINGSEKNSQRQELLLKAMKAYGITATPPELQPSCNMDFIFQQVTFIVNGGEKNFNLLAAFCYEFCGLSKPGKVTFNDSSTGKNSSVGTFLYNRLI